MTRTLWNTIFLEQPMVPVSGDSRYLTRLLVSGNEELRDGFYQSNSSSSQSIITDLELQTENLSSDHRVSVADKIRAALKCLTFREQHVLVQFWSPREVGKHQLLTTLNQPFGVGVPSEELCFYRKESEHNVYLVDKDHEEEDISPLARVFRRGLPEWTTDLSNYNTKDFPQLECAIRCNFHGYLALPVFDPTTRLCVGVLEILTSVKYTSYAFEVKQVHEALKAEHLSSPQVFDSPIPNVLYEHRQTELDKILNILKTVCDTHNLPLAQTWTVSPSGSFVSNNKVIEKTCSSFDTRCIGKVCMSTTALPFYVRDMSMWNFRNACREQHLDKYRGLVGKALLARGSCFCEDVTELDEEEYPLVHNARMSKLNNCVTVYLHSVELDDGGEYVLEFFPPPDDNNPKRVLNLVQTLKQNVEFASGFELGETSHVHIIEPPRDINHLFSNIDRDSIQTSSNTTASTSMDSSDSESVSSHAAKTDPADVISRRLSNHYQTSMQTINDTVTDAGKKNEQSRKRTIDSMTVEAVDQHVGKPLGQTAQILDVSKSTLKRFCRKHGVSSWPMSKHGSSFVDASSLRDVGHGSDTRLLTVKASFKDDIVKFRFLASRGFTGLQHEVVKRMNIVKGERFKLKYEDEEKDLVMITCDADLELMVSNTTIKLLVEACD